MTSFNKTLTLLLAAGLLAGCGLKGDLYLEEPEEETPPAPEQPQEQEQTESMEEFIDEEQFDEEPFDQVGEVFADDSVDEGAETETDSKTETDTAPAEETPQDAATSAP